MEQGSLVPARTRKPGFPVVAVAFLPLTALAVVVACTSELAYASPTIDEYSFWIALVAVAGNGTLFLLGFRVPWGIIGIWIAMAVAAGAFVVGRAVLMFRHIPIVEEVHRMPVAGRDLTIYRVNEAAFRPYYLRGRFESVFLPGLVRVQHLFDITGSKADVEVMTDGRVRVTMTAVDARRRTVDQLLISPETGEVEAVPR